MLTCAWFCVLALAQATQGRAAPAAKSAQGEVYSLVTVNMDGLLVLRRVPGVTLKEVRLLGVGPIETPHDELAVAELRKFLGDLLKDKAVRLKADGSVGRPPEILAAHVYRVPDDLWINLEVIRAGYGVAAGAPAFTGLDRFQAEEQRAREGRLGLWSPEELARIVEAHEQAEEEKARIAEETRKEKVAKVAAMREQAARWRAMAPVFVPVVDPELRRMEREERERRSRWEQQRERDRRDDENEDRWRREREEEDRRRREYDLRMERRRAEHEQALARQQALLEQQQAEAAARQARPPAGNPTPGPTAPQPKAVVMPGAKFSGPLPAQAGSSRMSIMPQPPAAVPAPRPTAPAPAPAPKSAEDPKKAQPVRLPGR